MTRRERVIRMAGFFDGEGSILIGMRKGTGTALVQITVTQVDRRPLYELEQLFGGANYIQHRVSETRRNATWQWHLNGALRVVPALTEMRPFLIVKREQADVALRFAATIVAGNNRTSPRLLARRRRLIDQLHALR